jgi:FkbM family methyltransferase
MLSLYDCAVRYAPRAPLPMRGQVRKLNYSGNRSPIFVRIGSSDASVAEEIFVRDVYAAVTALPLGDVRSIVDLGANVGATVVHWMNEYPNAKVVAVEPDPENIEIARRNAVAAGTNATFVQACVSSKPGTVSLDRGHDACAFRMTDAQPGTLTVPAVTMDDLLREYFAAGVDIDLLKCDIEGAEQAVFGDCRNWIGRVRTLVIELHDPYSSAMFLRDLAANGGTLRVTSEEMISGNPVLVLQRP